MLERALSELKRENNTKDETNYHVLADGERLSVEELKRLDCRFAST